MKSHLSPEDIVFYSTSDVSRLFGVDKSTVKRWADSGKLRCYKTVGKHRRFLQEQIQEFATRYHLEELAMVPPCAQLPEDPVMITSKSRIR